MKSESQLIQRKTSLTENVLSFIRYLREKGFAIGPNEEIEALKGLSRTTLRNQEEFMLALRAILARNRKQWMKFEKLFLDYWSNLDKAVDSKKKDVAENTLKQRQKSASFASLKNWLYGNKPSNDQATETAAYSNFESLTHKDFNVFTDEEVGDIKSILAKWNRSLSKKKRRRFIRSRQKSQLDLRRTLRSNIRSGTEMIQLKYKSRQKERIRLLVLCDVSKSMDIYSQFLIQFLYAFQDTFKSIETFIFSSGIQRISPYLKDMEFNEALEQLSEEVHQWSGGTRIGESLNELIRIYKPLINQHTRIILLSDGWDDGDLALLDRSMHWLKRKTDRIIWLNPLMGNPDFSPQTGGMKTALPYVDVLHPCHNLASLQELIEKLD